MRKLKRGDKVILNSKNDFSEEQANRDWTERDGVVGGLVYTVSWANGGFCHVEPSYVAYRHAVNRFALVLGDGQ